MPDDTRRTELPQPTVPHPHEPRELPRTPLPFVLHYIRDGFILSVAGMVFFYGLSITVEMLQPYVLGRLVNTLAGVTVGSPGLWFAGLCATWLGSYVLSNVYGAVTYRCQIGMRVRIHEDLFAYLFNHAPRYFLDQASGALAHKIRTAASSAQVIIEYLIVHFTRFVILAVGAGLMIARTAPELLLPAAIFAGCMWLLSAALAQRMRVLARAGSNASSEQVARMGDAAANWELVRSFAAAWHERLSLAPFNRREAETFTDLRYAAIRLRLLLHALSFAFLAWLAWQGLAATRAGTITVGTFTMLVSLYILVGGHIRSFGDAMFTYFEHVGQLTDVLNTILTPHEIVDPPGAGPLQIRGGQIEIQHIDFSYPDGTPVFRDFDLAIGAGEKVGLVGASGAGKSSLIKLIRRQFPLQSGQVLIDGQDIATVTWDSLHEAFAEVPQNPGMFHRSVRENIAYGRPDATEAEIVAAAKRAHCHEFIASRAQGYDSIVGEKGMKLSGGERQRVAIARAFLKNAPILLLDEATSSLDSEAEHLIQEALLTLMSGRTVIAIAHRLSTIMHLDRIVVLEAGRIVEQGSHGELLARNGAYARLWQRQAGGFM